MELSYISVCIHTAKEKRVKKGKGKRVKKGDKGWQMVKNGEKRKKRRKREQKKWKKGGKGR